MNKDKALESVNEIKELMEKSSKFISISGLAAIMAGVYALAGTYIATCLVTPDTTLIVALKLMIMVAILVLAGPPSLPAYCLTTSPKSCDKNFSAS